MQLSLIGINHISADINIRETVAVNTTKMQDALTLLRSYMPNGVILSTCNRTEIYFTCEENRSEKACLEFLKDRAHVDDASLLPCIYSKRNKQAVEHLFRVASGIESMIVGEFEVLGQVKYALVAAEKAGMVNLLLRRVFQSAVRTGRRVRSETSISRNSVSASSIAVDLAEEIIGSLKKCKMLVLGAGEAGRLIVKVARERGTSRILIASRTMERARTLAATMQGIPISLDALQDELKSINLIMTCAGAPHKLLYTAHLREIMKNRPELPLVIIDIAVPRNVESSAGDIENVFLYNIDDLVTRTEHNRDYRENAVEDAACIVNSELEKFSLWWKEYKARPLIRAILGNAEEIRRMQLNRTLKKLPELTEDQYYSLEMMTKAIVNKILKDPVNYLKANGTTDDAYAEIVKQLFHLSGKDTE